VIAMPTSPTPAFRIGERVEDPLQMYLADVFTVSANLAGLPAISVPCGFTADRLPIGLQLTGRRFDEATLLASPTLTSATPHGRNSRRHREPLTPSDWTTLSDEKLLEVRMCDLG
jgi:Asp-tRNA(Asn)/Glu-tRNA(Gln) amidotransferase A subunit family amidase